VTEEWAEEIEAFWRLNWESYSGAISMALHAQVRFGFPIGELFLLALIAASRLKHQEISVDLDRLEHEWVDWEDGVYWEGDCEPDFGGPQLASGWA
jgi:hypothetical protein